MTDIATPMRASFCVVCAMPTGELYPQDGAPTVTFCNDCENLPAPWQCDYDGNTEIGRYRHNRNDAPADTRLGGNGYEARLRRAALGIDNTPAARPATVGDTVTIPVAGQPRDAQGRFAPRTPEPTPEPPVPTIPTCEDCGGHRFYAEMIEYDRVRRYGDTPTTDCTEYDQGDMVVGVETYIDVVDNEEHVETEDTEVQTVLCADCGTRWQGDWERI